MAQTQTQYWKPQNLDQIYQYFLNGPARVPFYLDRWQRHLRPVFCRSPPLPQGFSIFHWYIRNISEISGKLIRWGGLYGGGECFLASFSPEATAREDEVRTSGVGEPMR